MNIISTEGSGIFINLLNKTREKFFGSLSEEGVKQTIKDKEIVIDQFKTRKVLKIGDKIPSFELVNYDGVLFDIGDELEKNNIVLSFYRGAWCPFCNLEIQMLQSKIEEIRDLGANIVAISPESPDYSILFKARHHIQFPVLSDAKNEVASLFGLEYEVPPQVCDVLQHQSGLDFSEFADPSEVLPLPATYIVDRKGIVRYSFVNPDYTQRLNPEIIISELKKLRG